MGELYTDGLLAMVRVNNGRVVGFVLGEGTTLRWGDQSLVTAKSSVCVSAGAGGVNVQGRRRARKGLPAEPPIGVRVKRLP